ncbi:Katanin p60 ATPase-containing subunit A-like 2 [Coelomomyces lativittatus]|nr:Katanin p60 ATPase-containing subunit A-like 2 [Coelomomyces lativittatus]
MSEPSLVKLRLSSEARNLDEKRELHRKKSAIVLILHHLEKNGYIQASKWLEQESGITTANYTPADNVDLLYILQEFEDYQRIKYNRNFKLIRNAAVPSNASYPKPLPAFSAPPSITKNIVSKDLMKKDEALKPRKLHPIQQAYQKLAQDSLQSKESEKPSEINDIPPLELQGTSMPFSTISPAVTSKEISTESAKVMSDSDETLHVPNPLKSSIYPLNTEYRDLSSMILQEIIQKSPNISFESIQGLEKAKKIIKEALIFPTQFPELFHPLYLFSPWKGILLYGPPGTGKTTLAKAIATECGTTFFHVSASSIVSKWRGESEKLVRVLFELARHHAPSTIFIDEVEVM